MMKRLFGAVIQPALLLGVVAIFMSGQARAHEQVSAVPLSDCNYDCLIGFANGYMDALGHKDPTRVAFSKHVRFTENDVEMPLGNDGLWGSIDSVLSDGLTMADIEMGSAAWFGMVQEDGHPAYFAMRLKVRDRKITEVETVVNRQPDLPKPFGNPKTYHHDPAFNDILPPEDRRSRQRLIAVASGYFSTVERNDGQVLTQFDDDCQRIENGISTTAGNGGSATIAQGCEAQFKLGIYRINKRVRNRRYVLVDEKRGIVVVHGYFDHANTFDTYKLTDGRAMKTFLKWPNSLTLLEAFKIRAGKIYRIEAIFTYAPYFMHAPWEQPTGLAGPLPPEPESAAPPACDRACLIGFADDYMAGLAKQDHSKVRWAKLVRYSENEVPMMIGDGLWGTADGKSGKPLYAADPETGNVAWFGTLNEHKQPGFYAMTLHVRDGKIEMVRAFVAHKESPGPFGDPTKFAADPVFGQVLPVDQRRPRQRMVALVDGYFSTKQQDDGQILTELDPDCTRTDNGLSTTSGDDPAAAIAKGCEGQFKAGVYRPIERIRDRQYPVVDEERGVVVATAMLDSPVREPTYRTTDGATHKVPLAYPNTRAVIEIFKIRNGKIYKIQAVSSLLPYLIPSPFLRTGMR
jgi:hypothetical protein